MLTVNKIAEHLGVSRSTSIRYRNKGMPLTSLEEVEAWVKDYTGNESELDNELKRAQIRKLNIDADYKETMCKKLDGELITIEQADKDLGKFMNKFDTFLKSLPEQVAMMVSGNDRPTVLKQVSNLIQKFEKTALKDEPTRKGVE
jgi:predicted site-specific integrase-resolvase